MALTAGRASNTYQTLASAFETMFQSPTHGSPCKGFSVTASDQPAVIRVTGVHNYGAGTLSEYRLDAGESKTFYAGPPGISKVEAKYATAGALAKWSVIVN